MLLRNSTFFNESLKMVLLAFSESLGVWACICDETKKTITTDYMKKRVMLSKGDEVGMFKSGSTVILLFDRKYKLAESLKKNKLIRVGEKIGIYS